MFSQNHCLSHLSIQGFLRILFNSFTPEISIVILFTIYRIILIMLVWIICYWINQQSPNLNFFSHHFLLHSVLTFFGEILFSHP